jgi:hypothetical protein
MKEENKSFLPHSVLTTILVDTCIYSMIFDNPSFITGRTEANCINNEPYISQHSNYAFTKEVLNQKTNNIPTALSTI